MCVCVGIQYRGAVLLLVLVVAVLADTEEQCVLGGGQRLVARARLRELLHGDCARDNAKDLITEGFHSKRAHAHSRYVDAPLLQEMATEPLEAPADCS